MSRFDSWRASARVNASTLILRFGCALGTVLGTLDDGESRMLELCEVTPTEQQR